MHAPNHGCFVVVDVPIPGEDSTFQVEGYLALSADARVSKEDTGLVLVPTDGSTPMPIYTEDTIHMEEQF
jgi:hypothetical protein